MMPVQGANMPKFEMQRSYCDRSPIDTQDLLTAVKYSLNWEADLFMNGRLIASWLHFSKEENSESLSKLGITMYVENGRYCFKYTDESKNTTCFFADIYPYIWDGSRKVQVHIRDYRNDKTDIEFATIDEILAHLRDKYLGDLKPEDIHIAHYDNSGCNFLTLDPGEQLN